MDDHDPVGQRIGLLEIVRGQDDAAARCRQAAQRGPERAADLDVEAGGRLVEEDELGVPRERDPEQDAALLASR
jgi:hypothetical protein